MLQLQADWPHGKYPPSHFSSDHFTDLLVFSPETAPNPVKEIPAVAMAVAPLATT